MLVATGALALAGASYFDLRTRHVPNWLVAAYGLAALAETVFLVGGLPARLLIGAVVFAVLALAFSTGGIGGADVKLCAITAFLFGPLAGTAVLASGFAVAVAFGVSQAVFRRRPFMGLTLPFAPCLLAGLSAMYLLAFLVA